MDIRKVVAFTKNDATGMAVFSGPSGHILMAKDKNNVWEKVSYTEDDQFALKFLGASEE